MINYGPLYLHYGHRVVYDAEINCSIQARVSSVIPQDIWKWYQLGQIIIRDGKEELQWGIDCTRGRARVRRLLCEA